MVFYIEIVTINIYFVWPSPINSVCGPTFQNEKWIMIVLNVNNNFQVVNHIKPINIVLAPPLLGAVQK